MTRPTPPPALTLPPPAALAPVSAPPEALVVPGGWQIEGLPDIVLRAGPQAAERTVEFFTAQIRNPHTRAAVVPRLDALPYRPPQPTLRRV